jgi:hypothetical protein
MGAGNLLQSGWEGEAHDESRPCDDRIRTELGRSALRFLARRGRDGQDRLTSAPHGAWRSPALISPGQTGQCGLVGPGLLTNGDGWQHLGQDKKRLPEARSGFPDPSLAKRNGLALPEVRLKCVTSIERFFSSPGGLSPIERQAIRAKAGLCEPALAA